MSGFEPGSVERALAVFPRMNEAAAKGLVDALDKGAAEIAGRAKVLAPRRSGELERSIEVRDNLEGFRGTGAVGNFARLVRGGAGGLARFIGVFPRKRGDPGWYAAWVEFGTRRAAAQPFLGPAFFGARKRVTGRVKRALTKAAKEVAARGRR